MARYRKHYLPEAALDQVAERFKALSEPMRLRLVYALMDGEKTVSQLVRETGALQANVSKHLGILLTREFWGAGRKGPVPTTA
jgi:ArsR family transcriptional regulator